MRNALADARSYLDDFNLWLWMGVIALSLLFIWAIQLASTMNNRGGCGCLGGSKNGGTPSQTLKDDAA